jgi:hypothetical protein
MNSCILYKHYDVEVLMLVYLSANKENHIISISPIPPPYIYNLSTKSSVSCFSPLNPGMGDHDMNFFNRVQNEISQYLFQEYQTMG